MKDFNDIPNKEQYMAQSVTDPETGVVTVTQDGKWVAFIATEESATVLASAYTIPELVSMPELQGVENYIIHKF